MIKINNWVVSAFVTSDTPYELIIAQYLIPSLDKLGIPYYIEALENRGSWLKNVAQKPLSILHTFEKFPGKNVVSLDADAEVLQYPSLFNNIPEEYDLACHFLSWKEWYGHDVDTKELLTGTLWLKNNDKMKDLVNEWYIKANEEYKWEQQVLQEILSSRKDIKIYELPLSYVYIASLPDGSPPHIKIDNSIIIHHQISRILKRKIH